MTPHAARTIKESMKIETPATSEFSLYGKSTLIPTPHFRDKDKNKYYAGIFVGLAELENVNIAIITVINGPKQQASAADVAQQVSIDIVNKST
jgi:cell division protein FtsI/penicillin-binding protein 2